LAAGAVPRLKPRRGRIPPYIYTFLQCGPAFFDFFLFVIIIVTAPIIIFFLTGNGILRVSGIALS
jgi:hypothetical protein